MGGDEVGVRVATGAAVAGSSASPSIWLGESPRTAECIKKSAPAPTAPMLSSEASIAFVDTAPGRDAPRGREACSVGSNGCGGSGLERRARGFGTVQLCSSGWWIISYSHKARAGPPASIHHQTGGGGLLATCRAACQCRSMKRARGLGAGGTCVWTRRSLVHNAARQLRPLGGVVALCSVLVASCKGNIAANAPPDASGRADDSGGTAADGSSGGPSVDGSGVPGLATAADSGGCWPASSMQRTPPTAAVSPVELTFPACQTAPPSFA
jgi:hypothetical protein